MLWPLTLLHICAATIGLLSGFMAMAMRKGSNWHGAVGTVYFVAMVSMSVSAAYIAAFLHPIAVNLVVSLLTLYLVTTARWAAKRREGGIGRSDYGALLFILMVGITSIVFGFQAAGSPKGTKDGMPAMLYFIFGTIALLCAVTDVRMVRRGGAVGTQRMVRHLWRMCLSLLIATLSFYPGQAKLFSKAVRETNLLFIPHILLVGSMLFWVARMKSRRRPAQVAALDPRTRTAVAAPQFPAGVQTV